MKIYTSTLTLFALALTLALTVALIAPVPPAYALTFTVNALDDLNDGACNAAHCSLREAILAANSAPSNDSIVFSVSGTILLGAALPGIPQDSALIIDGADNITIDGGSRVRVLSNSGDLTLRSLIVTNGAVVDDFGGGVLNEGTLTIENSTFSNNTASAVNAAAGGGAIYNSGSLTINAGYFNANKAVNTGNGTAEGGAIYSAGEFTEVSIHAGATFKNNQAAHHGGAIFNALGYMTVKDSLFDGNHSTQGGGGGIYDRNGAGVTLIHTTLEGNSAEFGGGMFSSAYRTDIRHSTFRNNSARSTDGGGVYTHSSGVLNISNSVLAHNAAKNGGGVFALGIANLTNTTLFGNSATVSGGGVHARSELNIQNTTITDSASGGDCTLGNGGRMREISSNNLIAGTGSDACGLMHGVDGNLIGLEPGSATFSSSPAHLP